MRAVRLNRNSKVGSQAAKQRANTINVICFIEEAGAAMFCERGK